MMSCCKSNSLQKPSSLSRGFCLQKHIFERTLLASMKLEGISANNIELTSDIEEYVRMRIQKLSKIVQRMEPASIRVEVGKPLSRRRREGDLFYAELTASIQGKNFHSNKTDLSVFRAVEKARSDMHQKIIKWKKKERGAQRKQGAIIKRLLRSDPGNK